VSGLVGTVLDLVGRQKSKDLNMRREIGAARASCETTHGPSGMKSTGAVLRGRKQGVMRPKELHPQAPDAELIRCVGRTFRQVIFPVQI